MSWISDIQSYADKIPYGKINLEIEKVDRKTVKIVSYGKETLRYTSNDEAIEDLTNIIRRLADNGYEGKSVFELEYKQGKIRIVGIYDQKVTRY